MIVSYVGKRSFVSGHSVGNIYTLQIDCQDIPSPARRVLVEVSESISGARETLRYGAVRNFPVITFPLAAFDLALLREFLDSVEGGEPFTCDPYGTLARVVEPFTAVLEDGGYTETREVQLGTGGQDDFFSINFTIRRTIA